MGRDEEEIVEGHLRVEVSEPLGGRTRLVVRHASGGMIPDCPVCRGRIRPETPSEVWASFEDTDLAGRLLAVAREHGVEAMIALARLRRRRERGELSTEVALWAVATELTRVFVRRRIVNDRPRHIRINKDANTWFIRLGYAPPLSDDVRARVREELRTWLGLCGITVCDISVTTWFPPPAGRVAEQDGDG